MYISTVLINNQLNGTNPTQTHFVFFDFVIFGFEKHIMFGACSESIVGRPEFGRGLGSLNDIYTAGETYLLTILCFVGLLTHLSQHLAVPLNQIELHKKETYCLRFELL
jgi:hypothetical protein